MNKFLNLDLLEADAPVDLSADTELRPIWIGEFYTFSIQLVFTGTPAGTFKLQASNDPGSEDSEGPAGYPNVDNWTDIEGSDQIIAAAGNHMWTVDSSGYNWVRVVWTASGPGTSPELTIARCYLKGIE